jgi:hypothetical protein
MGKTRTLTRRELYDLVWATPIQTLAAEFGLSDVGLAKICERHRVPRPTRGYWAKVEAGKPAKRSVFVEISDRSLDHIVIHAGLHQLPEPARAIIERARAERTAARPRRREASPPPKAFQPVVEVHPAVRRTAEALRKAKPGPDGALAIAGAGACPVTIAPASLERAVAILDALARRLDDKGLPLTRVEAALGVVAGEDSVTFALTERTRRAPHEPTPAELEAEARRRRKLARGRWTDLVGLDRAYPEFDTVYTGELSLEIPGYGERVRRTWSDGKTQRLETLLVSVVTGVEALLAVRQHERERRKALQRAAAEAEARRQRQAAFQAREKRRAAFVELVASKLQERARLAAVLAHLEAADPAEPGRGTAMASWVRRKVAEIDALLSPAFLALSARSARLEFDEAQALAAAAEEPAWWYPRAVTLELWSIDPESGVATAQTPLEWVEASDRARPFTD